MAIFVKPGQIWFWQNFWLDLDYFSTVAVHVDYLQLKLMKLVLACRHLSDLQLGMLQSHHTFSSHLIKVSYSLCISLVA